MFSLTLDDEPRVDLRHYLQILQRHKWTLIGVTAGLGLLALAWGLHGSNVYAAQARIVLQPDPAATAIDARAGTNDLDDRKIATEIEVLKSRSVADAAAQKLGFRAGVTASAIKNTDVIVIQAVAVTPERAAKIANAFADAYADFHHQKSVATLASAVEEITRQMQAVKRSADALSAQISANPTSAAAREMAMRRDSLLQQVGTFRQQVDELQVRTRLDSGDARVVARAVANDTPIAPRPLRTAALGAMIGLILGIGVVFVREQLDQAIHTRDQLSDVAGDLQILGTIPRLEQWMDGSVPTLIAQTGPSSHAAEAYRNLRTAIQFLSLDRPMRIVQVTSSAPGEGKTTTLANLGLLFATAGIRVIIVGGDLRNERLYTFFDREPYPGVTSVLMRNTPLEEALQTVPGVPFLRVLPAGPRPPNPSEILADTRTGDLLERLRGMADLVLVDSPPVLPVTDASALSRWVDATIVVVRGDKTTRRELRRTLEMLRQISAPLLGIVFNDAREDQNDYGYGLNSEYTTGTHQLEASRR